jgi:hypothetical protein
MRFYFEKEANVKLRIEGIDRQVTPADLRRVLEPFGIVKELGIFSDRQVTYAIVTMPGDAAVRLLEADPEGDPNASMYEPPQSPHLREIFLSIRQAKYSPGPWVLHDWKPPKRNR